MKAKKTRNKRVGVTGKHPVVQPCEGIFYVVRFPDGWRPVGMRFEHIDDCGHPDFWRSQVVPMLARSWSAVLGSPMNELKADLNLCEYGFPRGRVVRQGNDFVILHGEDLERFMKISRKAIETLFGISGKAKWQEDEHEHCLKEDKESLRQMLRLDHDWRHAEVQEHE